MENPKQQCEGCCRRFKPDPSKQGIQRFCARKRCQRKRHRLACQAYRRANPEDDDNRRPKIRDWAAEVGYWAWWRETHPEYREREKARMRRNRRAARRVAKRDARKESFVGELQRIQAEPPETVAKRDAQYRRVNAILSCLIWKETSQNETYAQTPSETAQ